MTSTEPAGGTDVLERTDTTEQNSADTPWRVILWNDPVNLISYVTATLVRVLDVSREQAETYMLLAHTEGRTAVADGTQERCQAITNKLAAAALWATMEKS